jgi:hypothetical protein
MAKFDPELWAEIAPRFKVLRAGIRVEKFLADIDELGLKWRMLEAARQGMTVESTVKLLRKLGVSPNWFLLGIEPIYLSELEGKHHVPSIDEMLRQIVWDLEGMPKERRDKKKQDLYKFVQSLLKEEAKQHKKTGSK